MSKCVVCKSEVEWSKVKDVFEHILKQADRHGVESLTEQKQVVYESLCCSAKCYKQLK